MRISFAWSLLLALFALSSVLDTRAHSGQAVQSFRVVSDLDDTIKITNVLDKVRMAYNSALATEAFGGMMALLNAYSANPSEVGPIQIVSGSPFFMDERLNRFLNEAGLNSFRLTLNDTLNYTDWKAYKLNKLGQIAKEFREPFVLIGDDTQGDPEAYAEFSSENPGRVLAIYIRKVTGRELPAAARTFRTAFDLASQEFVSGRISLEQALEVGAIVMETLDSMPSRILPRFVQCPLEVESQPDGISVFSSLFLMHVRIQAALTDYCTKREQLNKAATEAYELLESLLQTH